MNKLVFKPLALAVGITLAVAACGKHADEAPRRRRPRPRPRR